jgi:uncharacterized protein (DUF4415 family)
MTRKKQLSEARREGRRFASRATAVTSRSGQTSSNPTGILTQANSVRKRRSTAQVPSKALNRKAARLPMANPELYRPLKKPVTLRLDADVLAWFRRGGRRYQTRINQALRQVMEKEVKSSGR